MLIPIADVRAYLGITSTATDAILTILGGQVEAEVETYIEHPLARATYTDEVVHYEDSFFDGQYNPELDVEQAEAQVFLKQYPVVSLSSIKYNGTALPSDEYYIDSDTGVVTLYSVYEDRTNKLTATYVAGYTTATYPVALQMVVLEGIKAAFENAGASSQGKKQAKSKTVGDFSVTYKDTITNVGQAVVKEYIASNSSVLNRYKRTGI